MKGILLIGLSMILLVSNGCENDPLGGVEKLCYRCYFEEKVTWAIEIDEPRDYVCEDSIYYHHEGWELSYKLYQFEVDSIKCILLEGSNGIFLKNNPYSSFPDIFCSTKRNVVWDPKGIQCPKWMQ